MFYNNFMDAADLLEKFKPYMAVEIDEDSPLMPYTCTESLPAASPVIDNLESVMSIDHLYVQRVAAGRSQKVPLLKTVLTSVCSRNCHYCAFHSQRDFERHSLTPDQLARAFMGAYQAGIVRGLFLSSGIPGRGSKIQDDLLAAAELLRRKYHYSGYLHLKLMPGAEYDQVAAAVRLANRVSINLEAPTERSLASLAPGKSLNRELLMPLQWVHEMRIKQDPNAPAGDVFPSSTTQFVAGGYERDDELLDLSQTLYRLHHLKRIYYSRFKPVTGTPMENHPSASPLHIFRLYQASFLLRDYGYDPKDFEYEDGYLPQNQDPKLSWAEKHYRHQPLEITKADYQHLIRVPGIGPRSARWILDHRSELSPQRTAQLKHAGVQLKRAEPFIELKGRRLSTQLPLWT